jgi:outer membrane murein-binding lipoprotein Lpp
MKIVLMAAITSMLLAGCANLNSQQEKRLNLVVTKCPVLTKYSSDQLKSAAQELRNLPNESQVAKMVIDYGKLRDACRAIEKKLKKAK